ncbi:hypothetical protein [Thermococcus paralvinellae]|uniref:Uncharacterized protein n=1 Tax=Thermococcus paralvinellae TaxID=582419 RepID=W0I688_9EURY|nr:hypothetical protein [Thermococcus paralvinellae]AHF79940.1 Hypothetical protein TES1_0550 [Thermococcus paralvinellae]
MKIVVKPEVGWRKVVFQIDDETFEKIKKIAEKHGFRLDEALKIILLGEFLNENTNMDVKKLREEVRKLEEKLYEIEGKWSPLKFASYGIAMDNQNLAIQLSGLVAENKRLRKMLGKKEKDYREIEKLIHCYLQFEKRERSK